MRNMSEVGLRDAYCGEPIAWARIGDQVVAREWTEHRSVAVTEQLTPEAAVRKYGAITEVVLGPSGGFQSVTYGDKKFISRQVDPRRTGLYDEAVVAVKDPTRENFECLFCEAAPGESCLNRKQEPCGTHHERRQGRSRWEIERAVEEAERERQEAAVAELWQREMAEPPAIGTVLTPAERSWRPQLPELLTVKQTYANRTVRTSADSGEEFYLARNEYTGSWHLVCGMPTSARLPCRNSALIPRCQTNHVVGRTLRGDQPWS